MIFYLLEQAQVQAKLTCTKKKTENFILQAF
jgi:hypothetical protein